MSTENNKKQFCCEKCNFKCDKKYNWERHIMTSKHKINSKTDEKSSILKCIICNKIYLNRSGLWKHKQKCKENIKQEHIEITPELVIKLMKDNEELTQIVMEQSKQILELSKNNK
jgi:hypothetical protein